MEKPDEDTVEVRFVTQLDEFRVTETPFRVLLRFGRYGLSGVINHLLALEPPKPFDFLINGEFLRTNLKDFLKERHLSLEETHVIEYLEALEEPKLEKDFKHDDWVSSVDTSLDGYYLTGCYDSIARVWDAQGKCLINCNGHTGPITSIKRIDYDIDGGIAFVTGSKDQTVRIWQAKFKGDFANTFVGRGHEGAVASVSVCPNIDSSVKFCSGSWDKSIKIWDSEEKQISLETGKKKRKIESQDLAPLSTLDGHSQCVSCVEWIEENVILSGSWDHTLKRWDVEQSRNVDSLPTGKVIYGVSYQKDIKLVATAHADRAVRLWDLRSNDNSLVLKTLSSHKEWVSSVQWHPTKDNLLVSGSHDNTVKVWDIRSVIPLFTLSSKDKILCVDWAGQDKILGGGAECKLNVWAVKA
eukprot:TRINITY_DN6221_c0_g1_i1.p1 TRINITY_DN6221_c0_g1~~TRINITY_DN6221_c0_g1_i1.p1  ORF type:complete len:412 (-),score=115.34 TRINITY_DN6221_c0_g1_i1:20-1255(-)